MREKVSAHGGRLDSLEKSCSEHEDGLKYIRRTWYPALAVGGVLLIAFGWFWKEYGTAIIDALYKIKHTTP